MFLKILQDHMRHSNYMLQYVHMLFVKLYNYYVAEEKQDISLYSDELCKTPITICIVKSMYVHIH